MGRIRVISKKPVPKTHFDDDIVFDLINSKNYLHKLKEYGAAACFSKI